MELYHALPFFCYLLGKALRSGRPFRKVTFLGCAVLATFAVCWLPYLTSKSLIFQVLHRVFPLGRGLYEDKVANFWCSVSTVIKVRRMFGQSFLVKLSSMTTFVTLVPSCWNLVRRPTSQRFLLALVRDSSHPEASQLPSAISPPSPQVNSSLGFFLFSFQVHEKSILLAVLPASLLTPHYPHAIAWFSLVAAFSMYSLLVRDGLSLASWALCGLFYLAFHVSTPPPKEGTHWVYRAVVR